MAAALAGNASIIDLIGRNVSHRMAEEEEAEPEEEDVGPSAIWDET